MKTFICRRCRRAGSVEWLVFHKDPGDGLVLQVIVTLAGRLMRLARWLNGLGALSLEMPEQPDPLLEDR
jgi:hypothetical protein